jgi:hypothetical protein
MTQVEAVCSTCVPTIGGPNHGPVGRAPSRSVEQRSHRPRAARVSRAHEQLVDPWFAHHRRASIVQLCKGT